MDFLLTENGDYLLAENNDKIILEPTTVDASETSGSRLSDAVFSIAVLGTTSFIDNGDS